MNSARVEHDSTAATRPSSGWALLSAAWVDEGPGMLVFEIEGRSFLRHMNRVLVGTMLEVGHDVKDSDTIQTAIITGNRDLAGKTAPAQGLTLVRVDYD